MGVVFEEEISYRCHSALYVAKFGPLAIDHEEF